MGFDISWDSFRNSINRFFLGDLEGKMEVATIEDQEVLVLFIPCSMYKTGFYKSEGEGGYNFPASLKDVFCSRQILSGTK